MSKLEDIQDALYVLNNAADRLADLGIKVKVTVSTETLDDLLRDAIDEIEAANNLFISVPRRLAASSPALAAPVLDERGRKIKDVRNFLSRHGIHTGPWFNTPAGIPPHTVNKAWKMIMESVTNEKEQQRVLKSLTRGDRFGNINQDEEWDW